MNNQLLLALEKILNLPIDLNSTEVFYWEVRRICADAILKHTTALELAQVEPVDEKAKMDTIAAYWHQRAIDAEDKTEVFYRDHQECKAAGYATFHDLLVGYKTVLEYNAPQAVSREGWKLVPIEPTQAMCDAFNAGSHYLSWGDCYRRMLEAAPIADTA